MKSFKKSLAIVLAVMMMFSAMGVAVSAAFTDVLMTSRTSTEIKFKVYGDIPTQAACVKEGTVETAISANDWDTWKGALSGDTFTITATKLKAVYGEAGFDDSYMVVFRRYINGSNYTYITSKVFQFAPPAPVATTLTDTCIIVNSVKGCEYGISADSNPPTSWQTSNEFTGLTPSTKYTIYCHYVATTEPYVYGQSADSSSSFTTYSKAPNKPDKPVLESVTSTSIKIKEVAGVEFSIDNGATWRADGTFTKLNKDQEYAVIARCVLAEGQLEGEHSDTLVVRTATRSPYNANESHCGVTPSATSIKPGEKFIFTAKGDQSDYDSSLIEGDYRYIPYRYSVVTSDGQTLAQGTFPASLSCAVEVDSSAVVVKYGESKNITVSVYYEYQQYANGRWNHIAYTTTPVKTVVTLARASILENLATAYNVLLQYLFKGIGAIYKFIVNLLSSRA